MYGGSTTSILLNTPGESASIITAIDGNQMAKQGRGGPALATAAIGSFVAGLLATLALAFIAPSVVKFALAFGPSEYFALMLLAFMTVSAAFGESTLRGLTSLVIGLTLGMIGIDQLTGQARLTMGLPNLFDGISVTTLAVALFAVGEALAVVAAHRMGEGKIEAIKGSVMMSRADWKRSWKSWLRGTAIGFPIGAMPAGGADVSSFLSYSVERHFAKHPEEFGKGAIEGVAGPEAANNASAAGTLVPLLTLGLPTTATAAIMLAGFQQFGLQPGPLLFATNAPLVWGLIASLLVANLMLLVLNLPLIGLWVKLLTIPQPWLYAGILLFATLGTIGADGSTTMIGPVPVSFGLGLLLAFGILGYVLRRFHYPIAPVVVGLILGPMAEKSLRQALQISQGNWLTLFHSWIAIVLWILAIAAVVVPLYLRARGKGKVLQQIATDED
jgi:putative tricarboxylic transport membrane protein